MLINLVYYALLSVVAWVKEKPQHTLSNSLDLVSPILAVPCRLVIRTSGISGDHDYW